MIIYADTTTGELEKLELSKDHRSGKWITGRYAGMDALESELCAAREAYNDCQKSIEGLNGWGIVAGESEYQARLK